IKGNWSFILRVFVHDEFGELLLIGLTTREVGDADLLDRHGCLLGQGWQIIATERAFLACTRRWHKIPAGCGTTTGLPDRWPPRRVLNNAGGVNDTWVPGSSSRGGQDGRGRRPGARGVREGRRRHPQRRGHRRRGPAHYGALGLRLGIGLRPKRRVPAGHWSRAAAGGRGEPLKSLDGALTLHHGWASWVAPSRPWIGGPPPC